MASPNTFPGGFGFTSGPSIALTKQAFYSGTAYFVSSVSGTDTASSGVEPEKPCATLAYLFATLTPAANSVVFVAENHVESFASGITVATAGLNLIGLGTGSSRPRLTSTGASIDMFTFSGAGVRVENLYFPQSTGATSGSRILASGARFVMKDCYVECGANDITGAVILLANQPTIDGCTFASTATAVTAQPATGLLISDVGMADPVVANTTFTGGSVGWSAYAWRANTSFLRLQAYGITSDRMSDIGFTSTGSTGYLFGGPTANSIKGRLLWAA